MQKELDWTRQRSVCQEPEKKSLKRSPRGSTTSRMTLLVYSGCMAMLEPGSRPSPIRLLIASESSGVWDRVTASTVPKRLNDATKRFSQQSHEIFLIATSKCGARWQKSSITTPHWRLHQISCSSGKSSS